MPDSYRKTGYLHNDFKIFHIVDSDRKDFDFHYHDFYKLLLFRGGNVSYHVEGKYYDLIPNDIILVRAGEIHKPIIHDNTPYERIIVYLSSDFFDCYRADDYDLFRCFEMTQHSHTNLIRLNEPANTGLFSAWTELAQSLQKNDYATGLYQKIKLLECLILLNRALKNDGSHYIQATNTNHIILEIMTFINEHITENLTIDCIASEHYLSRFHLMHLFKSETGYTIGTYITEKRLFLAKQYIQNGDSVTDACYKCGFQNYSTFYHAFQKKYHSQPKKASDTV